MNVYEIWYMRPETFRSFSFGYQFVLDHNIPFDAKDLTKTHIYLKMVSAPDRNAVFVEMQGEVWSSHGEARHSIEEKGLSHTSMSVGDVIVESSGKAFMVDNFGFREILERTK